MILKALYEQYADQHGLEIDSITITKKDEENHINDDVACVAV